MYNFFKALMASRIEILGSDIILICLYSNIITFTIEDTKDKKLELDKYSTFFITIEFIMR